MLTAFSCSFFQRPFFRASAFVASALRADKSPPLQQSRGLLAFAQAALRAAATNSLLKALPTAAGRYSIMTSVRFLQFLPGKANLPPFPSDLYASGCLGRIPTCLQSFMSFSPDDRRNPVANEEGCGRTVLEPLRDSASSIAQTLPIAGELEPVQKSAGDQASEHSDQPEDSGQGSFARILRMFYEWSQMLEETVAARYSRLQNRVAMGSLRRFYAIVAASSEIFLSSCTFETLQSSSTSL